ncbi:MULTISPECIES: hypothetical protein [Asticcacaulis]|uniref:hypothetical protein n=1 Tax=Asticcacaulis TaxID=76890 RepID=UPI001AE475EC|nr:MULTISPECIES: hypothetical protein [Asticcacaulis]MBP2161255.1 hypothetical protein [Asticcacaulis solisilvae]MDR6802379.1 hypothetical protein [Asticcacaulis sp. BE141]
MPTAEIRRIALTSDALMRPAARRRVLAACGSVAVHAVLILFLVWQPHTGIHGNLGRYDGTEGQGAGFDPVFAELVSRHAAQTRLTKPAPPQPVEAVALDASDPADTAAQTPSPDNIATPGDPGLPAQTTLSGGAAPGTPNGQHALLEQIARCLPPDARPSLKTASLRLSVDGGGHLTAAPRLEVDVTRLTETQLRGANQIVQAAMQCGPYVVTQGQVAMIDIVPDFTGISPAER